MKLSKADYERFARTVRLIEKSKTKRLMWGIALSELFEGSNALFDKKRFVTACAREKEDGSEG